jgi:TatD DNase family protein
MMLIDTHSHLYLPEFETDLEDVIRRAIDHRVEGMIVVGIDAKTSRQAIRLAEDYPQLYAAVGVHPNSQIGDIEEELEQIKELLPHPKVVAVGEIGLDTYREYVSLADQKVRLQRQLELASEADLPVIIHNRNAMVELYSILTEFVEKKAVNPQVGRKPLGVLHSFSEDVEWAKRVIDLGFFIGVSGVVTFPNAQIIKEVVKAIPQQYLLLETDAPYLSPQPKRGKRNEPAYLVYTLQEMVNLTGSSVDFLANQVTSNAQNLFGIN